MNLNSDLIAFKYPEHVSSGAQEKIVPGTLGRPVHPPRGRFCCGLPTLAKSKSLSGPVKRTGPQLVCHGLGADFAGPPRGTSEPYAGAPFCGFYAWPRFAGSMLGPVLQVPCLAPFCGFLAWPRFAGSSRNPQNEEGSQRGLKFCGFLKEPTKQQRVGTDPTKRRGSPRGPKFYGCTVFTGKFCGFLKEPTKPRGVPEGSLVCGFLGANPESFAGSSRNRQNGFLKEPTKPRGVPEGFLVLRVPRGLKFCGSPGGLKLYRSLGGAEVLWFRGSAL